MSWKPDRSQRGQPRPAHTYRGARRNAERGTRISLLLKAERDKPVVSQPKHKYQLGVHPQ